MERTFHLCIVLSFCVMFVPVMTYGSLSTSIQYTSTTAGVWDDSGILCCSNATSSAYAATRKSIGTGICEPVLNADYAADGKEAGYYYAVKTFFHISATLPDNIAPNPLDSSIKIPGGLTAGASVEYTYVKSIADIGFYIDFVDTPRSKLITTFKVIEPAVSVKMNTLDYDTTTWGAEDYATGFPFTPLQQYTIKFTFTATDIEVEVNGAAYHAFPHRYPFSDLRWIRFYLVYPTGVTSGLHVSDVRVVIPD